MEISFILVEPAVPENVGAAARAIKTMGFSDLRLINPCDHLSLKSLMLGHGSHDILNNAKVFPSLEEALADVDLSFATTAKQRWVKQNVIPIGELRNFLNDKNESVNRIAIVFGREESGLTNQEISLCSRATTIPLMSPFPSLNLAQAVMIFAYSLSDSYQNQSTETTKGFQNNGFKPLRNRVIEILNKIGLTKSSLVHGRVLERLTEITDEDVNLLHSVTAKIIEKLEDRND
jgi:tRNA/rRNA methyltransferase